MLIRVIKKIKFRILRKFSKKITDFLFFINKVEFEKYVTVGVPILDLSSECTVKFGSGLIMINLPQYATLGKSNKCKFVVSKNAKLILGNNIGMSNVVIVATKSIVMGNNIMIGGGVTVVDSDFHSLNPSHWHTNEDEKNMVSLPVIIKDNVFIGMDSIILKGVTIGFNSIIAAGSVVTKSIPDNEIWGGNPAVFIKNNEIKEI